MHIHFSLFPSFFLCLVEGCFGGRGMGRSRVYVIKSISCIMFGFIMSWFNPISLWRPTQLPNHSSRTKEMKCKGKSEKTHRSKWEQFNNCNKIKLLMRRKGTFLMICGPNTLQKSGKHMATLWDTVSLTLLLLNFISFTQILIYT